MKTILTENIIKDLDSSSICDCARGLLNVAESRINDSQIIDKVKRLKKDNRVFWNQYLISDLAIAALDCAGIEKYTGDGEEIKYLLNGLMQR